MAMNVILTVVGSDRPGLTQLLAGAIDSAGGNWLESHLSRLAGLYVGSVLVELPESNVDSLAAAVRAVDSAGLTVTAVPVRGPVAARGNGQTLSLSLVGQDRPGIVNEVTAVLARFGINIEKFATTIEDEAWSGTLLFRAEAQLFVPGQVGVDAVQQALEEISNEIMVDFTFFSHFAKPSRSDTLTERPLLHVHKSVNGTLP